MANTGPLGRKQLLKSPRAFDPPSTIQASRAWGPATVGTVEHQLLIGLRQDGAPAADGGAAAGCCTAMRKISLCFLRTSTEKRQPRDVVSKTFFWGFHRQLAKKKTLKAGVHLPGGNSCWWKKSAEELKSWPHALSHRSGLRSWKGPFQTISMHRLGAFGVFV